jgi:hypothetical protein
VNIPTQAKTELEWATRWTNTRNYGISPIAQLIVRLRNCREMAKRKAYKTTTIARVKASISKHRAAKRKKASRKAASNQQPLPR